MSSSRPSIADLRAVAQPPAVTGRRSAEHWAGRLYMRAVSLHVTRQFVPLPFTPNQLTLAMIVVGLGAAGAAAWPGVWTAVLAAGLVQVYLLLDCVDGELARWRGVTGAPGVYLDRLGHFVVEAALVVAVGVRAAGGPSAEVSWWVVAGTGGALVVVLGKLESDLVVVARAGAGLPLQAERDPTSQVSSVRRARQLFALVPLHRLVGAVELSLLLVVAAVIDAALGDLAGTRSLLVATLGVALVVALGHPITILTSQRLR
jgi:phosphatidylglycerophosphate synthase